MYWAHWKGKKYISSTSPHSCSKWDLGFDNQVLYSRLRRCRPTGGDVLSWQTWSWRQLVFLLCSECPIFSPQLCWYWEPRSWRHRYCVNTFSYYIWSPLNEQIRLKVLLETVLQRQLFCNIVFFLSWERRVPLNCCDSESFPPPTLFIHCYLTSYCWT